MQRDLYTGLWTIFTMTTWVSAGRRKTWRLDVSKNQRVCCPELDRPSANATIANEQEACASSEYPGGEELVSCKKIISDTITGTYDQGSYFMPGKRDSEIHFRSDLIGVDNLDHNGVLKVA